MVEKLASDADILKRIQEFCASHDMRATTFGRKAIGDANLVSNLKADRSLTLKTANRVVSFMASYPAPTQADAA